MIRVVCPGCASKFNAKDHLAGQQRACPVCGSVLQIPVAEPQEASISNVAVVSASDAERREDSDESSAGGESASPPEPTQQQLRAQPRIPRRLNRQFRYLVCDTARAIALWENNGQGWMLTRGSGLVSAVRSRDELPTQGEFRLVEFRLSVTEKGRRLTGLGVYRLGRQAATLIGQGEEKVFSAIVGMGPLNRAQKNAVRQVLRDHFIRDTWTDSHSVLEFLANSDYHHPP